MNPRRDEGKRWRRLLADPWRKLASIALAVGLWFWLDSQVTEDRELICSVQMIDAGSPRSDSKGPRIAFELPAGEYTLINTTDPLSNDVHLTSVRLRFSGAKHLINKLRSDLSIEVLPPMAQLDRKNPIFEITRSDLRFADEELGQALVQMEPERVRVILAANQRLDVRLAHEYVSLVYPSGRTEDYAARLDLNNVRFDPEVVRLVGTTTEINAVQQNLQRLMQREPSAEPMFTADLSGFVNSSLEIKAAVTLAKGSPTGVHMEPEQAQISLRLRPDFHSFELEVPVTLVTSRTQFTPQDFEPIKPHKVTLYVASPLDAKLQGLDEQERRDWAQKTLCVLAALPENASLDRLPAMEGVLVFLNNDAPRNGIDYRAEMTTITVTPRARSTESGKPPGG